MRINVLNEYKKKEKKITNYFNKIYKKSNDTTKTIHKKLTKKRKIYNIDEKEFNSISENENTNKLNKQKTKKKYVVYDY